jgi:hypothetical protein
MFLKLFSIDLLFMKVDIFIVPFAAFVKKPLGSYLLKYINFFIFPIKYNPHFFFPSRYYLIRLTQEIYLQKLLFHLIN